MQQKIVLICSVCLARNYTNVTKGKGIASIRLALNKHCASCNRTTLHKESK